VGPDWAPIDSLAKLTWEELERLLGWRPNSLSFLPFNHSGARDSIEVAVHSD
jgi:hypothetical protein